MKDFTIHFEQCLFDDLRRRIDQSRFPDFRQSADWSLGTPFSVLQEVLHAWSLHDWETQQTYLNQFPQFICDIDGINIHFFHIKSVRPNAVPILMAHGWPDSFLRYSNTFTLLDEFDLIIPSIPGFGFSSLPGIGYVSNIITAELWYTLMTKSLGYSSYVATGGDMGRGILFYMAASHPESIIGLHLTDVGFASDIVSAPDTALTDSCLEYKRNALHWMQKEGAYISMQSTKPYSLGYGMTDSPVGMAAWLIEKFHDWSDWERFQMNNLLYNLTLYWMSNCIASSMTAYYGNAFTQTPFDRITAPVGIARFPHDMLPVPKEWIEKNFKVVQFTEMPYGGHFTAMEAPQLFADDLRNFIRKVR